MASKAESLVLANDVTEREQYIHAIEDQNKRLQEISLDAISCGKGPLCQGLMSLVDGHGKFGRKILEKKISEENDYGFRRRTR